MTIARNHHLFIDQPTYFHLISRCVRRAFLCGKDKHSGKRYDHRKRWLAKRLFYLSELFFIDLYAYAIMSNHYHLVVQTRPDEMHRMTDLQIARRWCRLFPRRNIAEEQRATLLSRDKVKIRLYRRRLCDISWLMRCLNEGLARAANKEDGCKGRFWEGRFRSQLLLDESALYTCMAYVDLNPVRAGMVSTPEKYSHTSMNYRIIHHSVDEPMRPINKSESQLYMMLSDYLTLVDETGRSIHDAKHGYVLEKAKPILARLNINTAGYMQVIDRLSDKFSRGVGSSEQLTNLSEMLRLRWIKGQVLAKHVFG